MEPKVLKTDEDYNQAVKFLEELGDHENFEENLELQERFELFSKLIADYENEHLTIEAGDPIEIIKLRMNYMNLNQKDLEQFIGSKGTVSEVLNKKRGLSKSMIRKLAIGLKINESILLTPYELIEDASSLVTKRQARSFKGFSRGQLARISSFKTQVRSRGMLLNICP